MLKKRYKEYKEVNFEPTSAVDVESTKEADESVAHLDDLINIEARDLE
jgi:hypothetical protein